MVWVFPTSINNQDNAPIDIPIEEADLDNSLIKIIFLDDSFRLTFQNQQAQWQSSGGGRWEMGSGYK